MNYIDAHCHLADPRYGPHLDAVLQRAEAAGIRHFVQGGVDPADWRRQENLRDKGCLLAFGLHPWFVNNAPEAEVRAALALLPEKLAGASALGELGLDFGPRMKTQRFALQREMFVQQLRLAVSMDKPLVLHLVGCHGEAPSLLAAEAAQWRGLVHGFTGSWEVARLYLKQQLYLSVGGAVTRPGYKKLKSAVKHIPIDRLVVESDAPDMAPAAYPGLLNEPESLLLVAAAIGSLRENLPHAVLAQSAENLRRLFRLEAFS